MATRSRIAIETESGIVNAVYCHWDGYVEGVGRTLFNHYDKEKLEKLIKLGDISSLREKIEPIGEHHTFMNPEDNVTVAYHRDRGEDFHSTHYLNIDDLFDNSFENGVEYVYCLNKDGVWLVNSYGIEVTPLYDLLKDNN
jgi:hypothetical protein